MMWHAQNQNRCHIQAKVHKQVMKISGPDFGHPYTKENRNNSREISGIKTRKSEKSKTIKKMLDKN